jgi:DEAD/DEAH box helicase domain-containing protein
MRGLEGAAQTAIALIHSAVHRGLRTIVYTQSRKITELIAIWASQKAKGFGDKICAYRAGFLPEERREIENRLSSGDLLAVVSTSALELGIDIGSLDICILVGYPGTIMSTWQRAGRVGRDGKDSALILVAHEDALDQYFINHPDVFFSMPPEKAMINPDNAAILERHLECAAAELSLKKGEPFLKKKRGSNRGALFRADGPAVAKL